MFKNINFVALGIAGGLIYVSTSGMIKSPVAQSALMAVGAVGMANQLPLLRNVVNGQLPSA